MGQAKTKQNILNSYRSAGGQKRGRKKKSTKQKKSGKAKRVIKNRSKRFDSKLLAVNTTITRPSEEIKCRDIPTLPATTCFQACTTQEEGKEILEEVLRMVIQGTLKVADMPKMRKSLSNLVLVQQDMKLLVTEEALEKHQDKENDKCTWDTMKRLGGFTQDELRDAVVNMPSKQFGPLKPSKRARSR